VGVHGKNQTMTRRNLSMNEKFIVTFRHDEELPEYTEKHERVMREICDKAEYRHMSRDTLFIFCPLFKQNICLGCCTDFSYNGFDAEWSFCSQQLKELHQKIINERGKDFIKAMCVNCQMQKLNS
jgi:hypothetical protein